MNITIASPWQVIEEKIKQQFSGCLIFSQPKDSSTKWVVYLGNGKLQYRTKALYKLRNAIFLVTSLGKSTCRYLE